MIEFATKEYLEEIIKEYTYSLLCAKKGFININKYLKHPDKLMERKDFVDFLVQKRKDMEHFYNYMCNLKYQDEYVMDFGNMLEIGAGVLDSLAIVDDYREFNISVMSNYFKAGGFDGINAFNGVIRPMGVSSEDDNINYKYVLVANKSGETLKNYNTLMYMNPSDAVVMAELYSIAKDNKMGMIGGIVSNQYDKNINYKLFMYERLAKAIEETLEIPIQKDEVNSGATIIRTIKYI